MSKSLTTCKRHSNLLLEEPINLNSSEVRHCPCCGRPSHNRPFDEYDMLSIKYSVAREVIQHIDKTRVQVFPKSESLQEFIVMTLQTPTPAPAPAPTNGYAPITVSCRSCNSVFRFHRTAPSPKTSPSHCVFCGSQAIHIHTQDNELDAWEILATAYKMPVDAIKLFYNAFAAQSQYTHFNDFMKMLKRQLQEAKEVS